MPQFSSDFDVIYKKKRSSMFHKLICQCHFHRPPEVQGPLKAHGPPDGPPKLCGIGVIASPCFPPLGGPA